MRRYAPARSTMPSSTSARPKDFRPRRRTGRVRSTRRRSSRIRCDRASHSPTSAASACRLAPPSDESPARRARDMAQRSPIAPGLVAEGARMASICNACRYCEGYCAVFPALERRLDFAQGDLAYLANLCHNCGSCYYACQYAPPHEFGLNFPRMLAEARGASYRSYAWPDALARLFERNGLVVSVATAALFAVFLSVAGYLAGVRSFFAAHADAEGAFYAVIPHAAMAWSFGVVF